MELEKLIDDLKKMLQSPADKVSPRGVEYYYFSAEEVDGIIKVLEEK